MKNNNVLIKFSKNQNNHESDNLEKTLIEKLNIVTSEENYLNLFTAPDEYIRHKKSVSHAPAEYTRTID